MRTSALLKEEEEEEKTNTDAPVFVFSSGG
jgi:hypothetical protein